MKRIFLYLFIIILYSGCRQTVSPAQGVEVVRTFENGSVKADRLFASENGKNIAYFEREYYETGVLLKEGPLKNGKPDGLWKSYYQNGLLWSEGEFSEGIRNGLTKTYHANGNLYYEGYYTNNTKDSLWQFWNAEGKFVQEIDFSKK